MPFLIRSTAFWLALTSYGCAAHLGRSDPVVYLNHFFVTLDRATYDAVRLSPELAALAGTDERSTKTNLNQYSGFYVKGRHTYLELMPPAPLPDEQRPDDSGIGFSVEQEGGLKSIVARLAGAFGNAVKQESFSRNIDGREVPWYLATGLFRDERTPFVMWVSEAQPGYLAARHPGARIRHPLSREEHLSWDFRPERLLDDVIGITLALDEPDARELAGQLTALGWPVRREGGRTICLGPDATITIIAPSPRAGIREAELRLRHRSERRIISLGSAELLLEGKRGWLRF